jgi:TolA-binding protein
MQEEFAALLFFFGISLTANIALAIGAWRSARRVHRFENRLLGAASKDDGRVDRLEQTVDSLDGRLEQLARGQEFLSKLVSERRHLPAGRERGVTPH